MTKKTRLTILLVCVACFLVISPILTLYSMGYRFDFEKKKITLTGGVYVRTYPSADQIIIDSKVTEKPRFFSNSIFVQSLLPNPHTVLVKKIGYYDYSKTLPVQEKEVTKLENILLIKKDIVFSNINADTTPSPFDVQEKYIIKNGTLYQKSTPLLKKIIAFTTQNNDIIWLGADGFLYKSDLSNLSATPIKITLTAIKISKTGSYKIIANTNNVFVNDNSKLLILDTKTNELINFSSKTIVKDAKISPDGKNIIYYNDNNIYISDLLLPVIIESTTLYKSNEKITGCSWLNNDYIIFTVRQPDQEGDKIIISEIDYRGNINAVTLAPVRVGGQALPQTVDKIFFNQQNGKLYILSKSNLLLSEKITQ